MSKKKEDRSIYDKNIVDIDIAETTREQMMIYAANINILRHIPMLVDGLKPVERRSLYTLYSILKSNHKSDFSKLAFITGNVMGFFHPHGDKSISDSIINMGQWWSSLQCLIEKQGNFGTPAGDVGGSPRYIEGRLSFYAYKCFFEEFDINAVDTVSNYLGKIEEPLFLPSKYPNILTNNVFGLGYGMSAHMPTFNLKEVFELTIDAIKGEDISQRWLYPDLASGATILDEGQFKEICITGDGKFRSRAVIDIDKDKNILTIRALPMGVTMESILAIISDEPEKSVLGLKDIKDYTNEDKVHVELYFRQEMDIMSIYYRILKKTRLEIGSPVRFTFIHNYSPNSYNLASTIGTWIKFRKLIKSRLLTMKLAKIYQRMHILEVLLFILNDANIEKTVNIIKKANNKDEIVTRLVKEYGITSLKAQAVANLRLSAFSKDSVAKYKDEFKELKNLRKAVKEALTDKNIRQSMIEELEEGIKLFGEKRRSKVIKYDNGEAPISDTKHVMVVTKRGYIKKLTFNPNKRDIGFIEQGDYPIAILIANNNEDMILFDTQGRKSIIPIHKIPNTVLVSKGHVLSSIITYAGDILKIDYKPSGYKYMVSVTKNGLIKKSELDTIMDVSSNNTIYAKVNQDDSVVDIQYLEDDKDLLIYTKKGLGVRFNSDTVPVTGRNTKGVIIMKMEDDDSIIGIDVIDKEDKYLVIITEKGNVKKTLIDTIVGHKRNAVPMKLLTLKDGDLIAKTFSLEEDTDNIKVYKTSGLDMISTSDIKISTRLAGTKKMIPVKLGDKIIDVLL